MKTGARAVRQRGWSALLAVLMLLASAGLGGPGGFVFALRGAPQAGSGAADGRDAALVRTGIRPAVLAQRSSDPAAPAAPLGPLLLPPPVAVPAVLAGDAPRVAVRAHALRPAPTHAYRARAPPHAPA